MNDTTASKKYDARQEFGLTQARTHVQSLRNGSRTQIRIYPKDQPTGEQVPIEHWSRSLAASAGDLFPDADRLKAHADLLRPWLFPFRQADGSLLGFSSSIAKPGQFIWIKETWANLAHAGYPPVYVYRADGDTADGVLPDFKWHTPQSMPRDACRLVLAVTRLRVQRICEITDEDALATGIKHVNGVYTMDPHLLIAERATAREAYFEWIKFHNPIHRQDQNAYEWVHDVSIVPPIVTDTALH